MSPYKKKIKKKFKEIFTQFSSESKDNKNQHQLIYFCIIFNKHIMM